MSRRLLAFAVGIWLGLAFVASIAASGSPAIREQMARCVGYECPVSLP